MPTKTATKKAVAPPKPTNGDDGRVQLQFRLTPDLRDRLRKEAERRDVSVNFLIERALEDGVSKWEKEKLRG
jgi:predicted HicB family RNase H-like nuclease